jgi:hypothetical protein
MPLVLRSECKYYVQASIIAMQNATRKPLRSCGDTLAPDVSVEHERGDKEQLSKMNEIFVTTPMIQLSCTEN